MSKSTKQPARSNSVKGGRRKPTLSDVAQASGVSASTVSRVLQGYTEGFSVKPHVREAILEAVEKLGYRANRAAKAVRSQHTGIVAVLGIQFDQDGAMSAFDMQTIYHMSQALRKSDLDVCHYIGSSIEAPYALPEWPVDGLCVMNMHAGKDCEAIEKSRLPYVSINGIAGDNGTCIMVDDEYGSKIAVDHFVEQGHERIAYIMESSWNNLHPSVQARRDGYVSAMRAHGLEPMPTWDQTYDMVEEAITEAYQHRCTAILVYSHFTAIVALKHILAIGLKVPEDISLICFNDHFPVKHTTPRITAVALPHKKMADAASKLLSKSVLKGTTESKKKLIKPELMVRDSVVRPG